MDLRKAEDFDPELLILFDAYVHGALDRRGFIERASKFAVGGVTGAMLLDALNPRFAEAHRQPGRAPCGATSSGLNRTGYRLSMS